MKLVFCFPQGQLKCGVFRFTPTQEKPPRGLIFGVYWYEPITRNSISLYGYFGIYVHADQPSSNLDFHYIALIQLLAFSNVEELQLVMLPLHP